jgi:hypothetical protein
MLSSGMLRRVALVRTDVSEEMNASFIRVTRTGELGTPLVFLRSVRRLLVTASVVHSSPILVTLMKEALSCSETSVLKRATRRNIPEDTILQLYYRLFQPTMKTLVKFGLNRYIRICHRNLNLVLVKSNNRYMSHYERDEEEDALVNKYSGTVISL